jgi:hypothetical protein
MADVLICLKQHRMLIEEFLLQVRFEFFLIGGG